MKRRESCIDASWGDRAASWGKRVEEMKVEQAEGEGRREEVVGREEAVSEGSGEVSVEEGDIGAETEVLVMTSATRPWLASEAAAGRKVVLGEGWEKNSAASGRRGAQAPTRTNMLVTGSADKVCAGELGQHRDLC